MTHVLSQVGSSGPQSCLNRFGCGASPGTEFIDLGPFQINHSPRVMMIIETPTSPREGTGFAEKVRTEGDTSLRLRFFFM